MSRSLRLDCLCSECRCWCSHCHHFHTQDATKISLTIAYGSFYHWQRACRTRTKLCGFDDSSHCICVDAMALFLALVRSSLGNSYQRTNVLVLLPPCLLG